MSVSGQGKVPVLLMVSGGSDSTALLELAARYANGSATVAFKLDERSRARAELVAQLGKLLPAPQNCALSVLHVNHELRGLDAEDDESFVVAHCRNLGIPCTVRHVNVRELAQGRRGGIEAVARSVRYRLAGETLDAACDELGVPRSAGIICTAHTLDDRIETFYMRTLVGTGPGGLGSIPRVRGRVRRPLLDMTREQLRDWLRDRHPGLDDYELWREDATNDDGSNFRSRVRTRLVPVLRELRPGFEHSLARTMDLIAQEDEDLAAFADELVRENMRWEGAVGVISTGVLGVQPRTIARRAIRAFLLAVNPDARLESGQINRIYENLGTERFTTETSGGIRVQAKGGELRAFVAQ